MVLSRGLISPLHGRDDFSKALFVAIDILQQDRGKTFGMLRRKDDPRTNLGPWRLRLDENEVDNELGIVMVNDRQVGISSLGDIFVELNFQFDLLRFFLCHWDLPFVRDVIIPRQV